jgi:hypothetical protein
MKKNKVVLYGLFFMFILIIISNLRIHNIENLDMSSSRKKYDSNNYDVQYHSTVEEIQENSNPGSYLIGRDGKLQYIPWTNMSTQVNYYEPGTFKYGSESWIPNYEESIILSGKK